jgi:hypothetical protein
MHDGINGIARYLKRATIIVEINDRTVSSVNFRITFDYMRYAFNYHHVQKLVSQVLHSQSREVMMKVEKNTIKQKKNQRKNMELKVY